MSCGEPSQRRSTKKSSIDPYEKPSDGDSFTFDEVSSKNGMNLPTENSLTELSNKLSYKTNQRPSIFNKLGQRQKEHGTTGSITNVSHHQKRPTHTSAELRYGKRDPLQKFPTPSIKRPT